MKAKWITVLLIACMCQCSEGAFVGSSLVGVSAAPVYTDYTALGSCVAALLFNVNESPFSDETANNNDATPIGGAAYNASGKYSGCIAFTGDNECADIADSASMDSFTGATQVRTVVLWVYITTNADNRLVCEKGDFDGDACSIATYNNTPYQYVATMDSYVTEIAQANTTGVWQHLALVYDGTNMTFYLNGDVVDTIICVPSLDNDVPFHLGGVGLGGGGISINGFIDELGIFNDDLSQTQIQELMAHGLKGNQ